jgi:hypothetical protein
LSGKPCIVPQVESTKTQRNAHDFLEKNHWPNQISGFIAL